ncbi:MAG: Hsp20/alpha crystallin family protein [Bacteriovorax sp.]
MLKIVFITVAIISHLAFAAAPKTSKPLPKSGSKECVLIANFDERMNQPWPDLFDSGMSSNVLKMNILELPDSYHIEAEMPGVKKEDVSIYVDDNFLMITGEKKSYNEQKKNEYRLIERSRGSFSRTMALPQDIDKNKITSQLKDGILKIDLMKNKNAKRPQSRKIELL